MFDTSSSDMNELCFMADTEASDGPTDVELGRADYWTCVKCKNRQNNPMYRYCEKCYQVNTTFFFVCVFIIHLWLKLNKTQTDWMCVIDITLLSVSVFKCHCCKSKQIAKFLQVVEL